MCSNALPLIDGTYGMTELSCATFRATTCATGVDRWFTIAVPSGMTLHVGGSTAEPMNGTLVAFDATDGCEAMHPVTGWGPLERRRHMIYMNTIRRPADDPHRGHRL